MQTKTAKSMVGVSLSVDNSQSLTATEYIKQRGNLLKRTSFCFQSLTSSSSSFLHLFFLGYNSFGVSFINMENICKTQPKRQLEQKKPLVEVGL